MDKALEQFLAVSETGSLVAAAEQLLISQPALTYSMKKLEKRLGVKLFERSSRGVRLTAYGETLHEKVLLMRRLYTNALDTIERQRAELEHGISIGTGYSTWILFLKDYVGEHFRAHPNAPINVSIGNAMRCMDQLLAGDISLFVGHRIPNIAGDIEADFIPLGMATDGYFVRRGHPLLNAPQQLSDIFSWPTTMAFPSETRQRRFQASNAEPQPDRSGHVFTSNSLEACLAFVNSTDAVLIHSNLLADFFRSQGIEQVATRPDELLPSWLLGIYVLKDRRNDPLVMKIIRLIRESAATLDLTPPA
jgi:LysR family transcriptional regulator, regulator of abg operon